jgi:uncharacterized protein YciW
MTATADIIDRLAGIAPGSALDAVRARRPDTRTWAQGSHDALFAPVDPGDVSPVERAAVAAFFAWANRLMLSLGEPAVPAG